MAKKTTYLKILSILRFGNLGCAAKEANISIPWFNLIVNGKLEPSNEVKAKLENVFGLPSEQLLKEIDENNLLRKAGA